MRRVFCSRLGLSVLLLACGGNVLPIRANPDASTATVAQGTATFSSAGSQLTINTSDRTFINWQSFNINAGETTTFVQPSSSSLVWNQIHDSNPSQILGTLNANGYVVLQNQSGFYIGGQAVINTHGLLLTTAPLAAPDLSSGGPWAFNAPPPTAQIVNYGKVNIAGGGSAFLIANDIVNHGTISASDPGSRIGLYAGQQVLVSTSPDGRGLSARVTLPAGSVDNEGHLIADAGGIALQAQVVNQGGVVQANSAQKINGTIELVASDTLNLKAGSSISATGDTSASGASPGGFVVLKSGKTFADTGSSTIDVGGSGGGQDGWVEVFGPNVPDASAVQSTIDGSSASQFAGQNHLFVNPNNLTLSTSVTRAPSSTSAGANVNVADLAAYAQIDLHALKNIELSTFWTLADPGAPADLSLTAGNNIILDSASSLTGKKNWSIRMTAGAGLSAGTLPSGHNDGIYLNGAASLQAQDGGIDLYAPNEVQVGWTGQPNSPGLANTGTGRIITLGGGGITVTALYGDVNTGGNNSGYSYLPAAPFYTPYNYSKYGGINYNASSLGGISTAGGGDVTIRAGGNVISFLPGKSFADAGDAGTGAFGSPLGDVTIEAGGNVYGHYVVANGAGSITAGQDIGSSGTSAALSLVKGSWSLTAGWNPAAQSVTPGVGDIYLQEVRNPNGVFNATTSSGTTPSAGSHLFDYAPDDAVNLTAGHGVYLTGSNLPRPYGAVPLLMPPTLNISAGSGGVVLQNNVTLFPSPDGELQINTTDGGGLDGNGNTLLMSDSGQTHWYSVANGTEPFTASDHGSTPIELNNVNPVILNIAGSMKNLILQVSKFADIQVGGDMTGCTFYGQNLHPGDVTSIDVAGQVSYINGFSYVTLDQGIPNLPAEYLPTGAVNTWNTLLRYAAVDPRIVNFPIPGNISPSQYQDVINKAFSYATTLTAGNFSYDAATKTLLYRGPMPQAVRDLLENPLTVVVYGANGIPEVRQDDQGNYYFKTATVDWGVAASKIAALYTDSLGTTATTSGGYFIGGSGLFDIHAASLSLGNSYGVLSLGSGNLKSADYSYLAPYIDSGATINLTVDQNLDMPISTIAALCGGDVNVTCTGGTMDLGESYLVPIQAGIMNSSGFGLGIYTSGGGNVNVTAYGDININSSRIATFNGGDITIESYQGNVDAGIGGTVSIPVVVFSPLAVLKKPFEYIFANGIVAQTLVNASEVPGSAALPGNITVKTPRGSIYASLGGILQEALNGNISAGPTVTLIAGSSDYPDGNINLGNAGVIGGTVNVTASGSVSGLVISRQDSTVTAAQSFSGTVLSGGTANLSAGGTVSGTIIGAAGVNASGGGGVTASLLSQNVSVNGGTSQSTLGTATATATTQSAAAQTSTDTKEQVAANDTSNDEKKKKKKKHPLVRYIKRVTVILPKSG